MRPRVRHAALVDDPARLTGLPCDRPDWLVAHCLRHTATSLAVQAGANVKHVQQMLGHASAAMTLHVYSGLFEDDLDVLGCISPRRAQPALVCPQCAPSTQQHLPRQATAV